MCQTACRVLSVKQLRRDRIDDVGGGLQDQKEREAIPDVGGSQALQLRGKVVHCRNGLTQPLGDPGHFVVDLFVCCICRDQLFEFKQLRDDVMLGADEGVAHRLDLDSEFRMEGNSCRM